MLPDRIYRSKIDVGVVFLGSSLPLLPGGHLFFRGTRFGVFRLMGWGSVMTLFIAVPCFPLRYTLRADALRIQSGLLSWDIPHATPRRISPSRNPLPAPAWSLRRVRPDHADGSHTLVSPDDQESFIKEPAGRCPHLARRGFGLGRSLSATP